jgi:IS5 family transposase
MGVDTDSALLHRVECTAANVSDVSQTEKLLPGKEESVGADAGYTGVAKRPEEQ